MAKEKREYLWQDRKRTFLGLPWSFTIYRLDEERLYIQRGFLKIREDQVRLYRIMDLSLTMGLGQRILGLGTIHCCSADKSLGDFDILSVKRPREVMEQISGLVEKQRDAKRVSGREFFHDEQLLDGEYGDGEDGSDG